MHECSAHGPRFLKLHWRTALQVSLLWQTQRLGVGVSILAANAQVGQVHALRGQRCLEAR